MEKNLTVVKGFELLLPGILRLNSPHGFPVKRMSLNVQFNSGLAHPLPIDWQRLHHLSEGSQEFEVELLKIFFVETKTRLQLLSIALAESDRDAVEHLAHQIKGSSGNLGFMAMYQTAAQLENQCRAQDISQSPDLLEELIYQLSLVQTFLENLEV